MPEAEGVDFSVYPNPNNGNFTVEVHTAGEIQPYMVEIFNDAGRLLGSVNCHNQTVSVNRTDLPTGVYFVKLTKNGQTAVKKVIVQ